MNIKLFLILIITIFTVSCSNHNPVNPTNTSNNSVSTINNKANSSNTDNDAYDHYESDGPTEYVGNAELIIKNLEGIVLSKDTVDVQVHIYEKDKIAKVCMKNVFDFRNIELDNKKHTYYSKDERGDYTLTMKVENNSITDFQLIILSKLENYKYYVTANKLTKLQRN